MRHLVLALVVGLTLTACGGIAKIHVTVDQTDRAAFEALKAFQDAEETEWHAKAPWPTASQHAAIGAKLSQAYGIISDTAAAALALQSGQTLSAQITAELGTLGTLVTDIIALTQPAPTPVAVKASKMKTEVDAFRSKVGGKK